MLRRLVQGHSAWISASQCSPWPEVQGPRAHDAGARVGLPQTAEAGGPAFRHFLTVCWVYQTHFDTTEYSVYSVCKTPFDTTYIGSSRHFFSERGAIESEFDGAQQEKARPERNTNQPPENSRPDTNANGKGGAPKHYCRHPARQGRTRLPPNRLATF